MTCTDRDSCTSHGSSQRLWRCFQKPKAQRCGIRPNSMCSKANPFPHGQQRGFREQEEYELVPVGRAKNESMDKNVSACSTLLSLSLSLSWKVQRLEETCRESKEMNIRSFFLCFPSRQFNRGVLPHLTPPSCLALGLQHCAYRNPARALWHCGRAYFLRAYFLRALCTTFLLRLHGLKDGEVDDSLPRSCFLLNLQ